MSSVVILITKPKIDVTYDVERCVPEHLNKLFDFFLEICKLSLHIFLFLK